MSGDPLLSRTAPGTLDAYQRRRLTLFALLILAAALGAVLAILTSKGA